MSSPSSSTGRTEERPCRTCGQRIVFAEFVRLYDGSKKWHCRAHMAPCGVPCMAGGVNPKDYRLRNVHGAKDFPCPICGGSDAS